MNNNVEKKTISPKEAVAMTIGALESVSIPASVLAVLSPMGIQTVMKSVIQPIETAKRNLDVLMTFYDEQEKQATQEPEDVKVELVPKDEVPEEEKEAE